MYIKCSKFIIEAHTKPNALMTNFPIQLHVSLKKITLSIPTQPKFKSYSQSTTCSK